MADSVMIKHASSGLVKKVWLKPGNMGLVGHIYSLGGWFRCFGVSFEWHYYILFSHF